MVESNRILYKPGEKPDHCVVIKYVPYVGKYAEQLERIYSEDQSSTNLTLEFLKRDVGKREWILNIRMKV